MNKKKMLSAVLGRLERRYGRDVHTELKHRTASDLFTAVLLSPQCTDKQVNAVTRGLFKKYKTFSDYANAPRYSYSFTINLTTPNGEMFSTVISSRSRDFVYSANEIVGTASIQNVSYTGTAEGPLRWHSGSMLNVDPNSYVEYSRAMTNAKYLLWYYNKTDISSPEQSAIQQAIAAYENASSVMIRTADPANDSCRMSYDSILCTPRVRFTFVILISLNDSNGVDSTVYYNGSKIEIT